MGSAGALDSLQLSLVRELVPPAALKYEGIVVQEQEGLLASADIVKSFSR